MPVTRIPYKGKNMKTEKVAPVILVYLVGDIADVPHLLLVRRGENVGWMKNMWSTIAGFINGEQNRANLQRQALIEIGSETSLLASEVDEPDLLGVFEDQDDEAGKIWKRHLLVSKIKQEDPGVPDLGVRLDWEHKEGAWVPVKTILEWLDGRTPEDPVAAAILCEEEQVPGFKLNLERIRSVLEKTASSTE